MNSKSIQMGNKKYKTEIVLFTTSSSNVANRISFNTHNNNIVLNKFESVMSEIRSLKELHEDWDGYGASKVSDNIIAYTESLISTLSGDVIERISSISPNPHGTLTIEWTRGSNNKISLEIGESNYSYFVSVENSNPSFVNGSDICQDSKTLAHELNVFYGKEISNYVRFQRTDSTNNLQHKTS